MSVLRKSIRFFIIGVVATGIHVVMFTALVEYARVRPIVAVFPAFLSATLFSYAMNRRFTFRSSAAHADSMPRYVVVAGSGLLLNAAITYAIVDILRLWYGWALLLCVAIAPVMTFMLNLRWTFAPRTGG